MSLRLGDQIVSVADAKVEEGESVNLTFDPTKMMPIFMPTEDFNSAMEAVGLSQVLSQEPDHQGRAWHNYIRRAGVPLGKFLSLLTQSEGFKAEGGIAVGFVEPTQPAEEAEEAETEAPPEEPTEEAETDVEELAEEATEETTPKRSRRRSTS